MYQPVKRTWFPTAVFAAVTVGCSLLVGQSLGGGLRSAATVFLVMPPLWWWLVVRPTRARVGRGAAAGALAAVLVWLMSLILVDLWWRLMEAPKTYRDAFGEGTGRMILLLGLAGVPVSAALGALLGALTAHLQNRGWRLGPGDERRAGETRRAERPGRSSPGAFVKETWFATLMFVAPSVVLDVTRGARPDPAMMIPLLAILAVTPPVWWWMVARHGPVEAGRGAMAGMVVAMLFVLVELGLFPNALERAHPGANRDPFTMLAVLGFLWIITVPLGVVLGAVTAVLQRRVLARAVP